MCREQRGPERFVGAVSDVFEGFEQGMQSGLIMVTDGEQTLMTDSEDIDDG
jgi:hypothetical protein